MHRGYVKIYRCIKDNPMWQEKPFDRSRAWIDLLIVANHKDGYIRRRGIKINVHRGEVGYSLRDLAERWGWSVNKVRRYFLELKKDEQIRFRMDTENVEVTSLICLINYELYQSSEYEDEYEDGPKTDPRRIQNKNVKNLKNKNLSASLDADHETNTVFYLSAKKRKLTGERLEAFNKFMDVFGDKRGKAQAADAWIDIKPLSRSLFEQILLGAKKYAEERPSLISSGRTPKMAQGWITGRRWEDENKPEPVSTSEAQPDLMAVTSSDSEAIRRTLEAYNAA